MVNVPIEHLDRIFKSNSEMVDNPYNLYWFPWQSRRFTFTYTYKLTHNLNGPIQLTILRKNI